MSCDIRIGTSGYHYRHWKGTFYPEDISTAAMLPYYLHYFDTLELNNTFYRLPTLQALKAWRDAVPDNFVFAVKASRFLTHNKKLKDPENALENFLPRVETLGSKLGPILFQLPPRWKINLERLQEFLVALPRKPRYAFEFRETTWITEPVLELLREHQSAFCIYEIAGYQSPLHVTTDFAYVRLHGPSSNKYAGSYSDRQLEEWAEWIEDQQQRLRAIYFYFDNDQAGYAAQNALTLRRLAAESLGLELRCGRRDAAQVRTQHFIRRNLPRTGRAIMGKKQSSAKKKKAAAVRGAAHKATVHEFPRRTSAPMEEPKSPLPPQHQEHPGIEAEIEPRPRYWAPHYRGSGKLMEKVALITGGDSGIGRAVAVLYAREGADVAIVYLPQEQIDAEETRDAVENEGRRALLIPGDVSEPDFCRNAVDKTLDEFGELDILVNNAAFQQHQESIEDLSEEQFEKTFRTNIFGYFFMAKAAIPHLQPGSAIVNTGSITGLEGNNQLLDYSATKGAIHAFTKSLAQNLVERRIRVNCVAPGPVWTPLNVVDKEPQKVSQHGADVPMKRPAQPEEVAPAYVFFASETDSSYITGEVLTLLGGETAAA